MTNHKQGFMKKAFALLIVAVMLCGILPVGIFAQDHSGQVHVIIDNTVYTADNGAAWDGTLVDAWVDISSDSTMMSSIVAAANTVGATITGAESNYISAINGLAAGGVNGADGWMGTLNDWFTSEGFGAYTVAAGTLAAGDEIHIMYSLSMGEDLGGTWSNNDKTVAGVAFSAGTLSAAFDKDTHAYTLTVDADTTNLTVTPTAANKNFQVHTYLGTQSGGTEYKRTAEIFGFLGRSSERSRRRGYEAALYA